MGPVSLERVHYISPDRDRFKRLVTSRGYILLEKIVAKLPRSYTEKGKSWCLPTVFRVWDSSS